MCEGKHTGGKRKEKEKEKEKEKKERKKERNKLGTEGKPLKSYPDSS